MTPAAHRPGKGNRMQHLLVANRAAVAVRIARTCRALGIETTALSAATDAQDTHTIWADHAVRVPGRGLPDTYDSPERVLDAVDRCGVDSVHPGYGSLAEDADFVQGLEARGVTFVGPSSDALRLAGSKAAAVEAVSRIGVPVLPHARGHGPAQTLDHVRRIGLPAVLKPEFGYGGQGVRIVHSLREAEDVLATAPADMPWYVEQYLADARVVGVCLAVDTAGTVIGLGERESLLVADGLKLLEGSPVLGLPADTVDAMRADAARAAAVLGLRNVMTVEFLASADRYWFLEVNGRLPLAYRMSECQTSTDLIALQLRLAAGEAVDPSEVAADRSRHCLEARLFVHPQELGGFPDVGTLSRWDLPAAEGVAYACSIDPRRPLTYELILAQALAVADHRGEAARRIRAALESSRIEGLRCYTQEITRRLADEC